MIKPCQMVLKGVKGTHKIHGQMVLKGVIGYKTDPIHVT